MSSHPLLSSPAMWGKLQLPNRMFMPPMGTHTAAKDGTLTQSGFDYLLERARGGCGLLITESMPVQSDYDIDTGSVVSLSQDKHIAPLARLVEAVHAEGSLIAANLTPGFGRVIPVAPDGGPSWSASDNTTLADPSKRCRELSTEQVEDIIAQFGRAVERAMEAGFDAIDIHGHTGYLTDQFLTAAWNRRTDRFGGDVAGRATFATELIRVTREIVGPDVPISMRITVRHQFPGGRAEAESRELALVLQAAGLDVLLVDAGSYEALNWAFPPYYMGDGVYLPDAAAVKPALTIPVAASGNLTPDLAEKALADGVIDFAGFGRPIIADPELPAKVMRGEAERVRPCIRCNQLCIGNVVAGKSVTCAVNPAAGREALLQIMPAEQAKKVAIVGAGPGGLEAARVAALRGHTVDVYERDTRIGGVLAPAATPDFKRELNGMIGWWEGELERAGVTVHLGHEIEGDDPALADADEVIVAIGAEAWAPALPGSDLPHVIDVVDAHLQGITGSEVVICGGGLSGADLALELAQDGKHVTIVEMKSAIATDMLLHNRIALLGKLAEAGVRILTDHRVAAFTPGGVEVEGRDCAEILPADAAVLAFGVRSRVDEVALLQRTVPGAIAVGDCVAPGKVAEAVNGGYEAALGL